MANAWKASDAYIVIGVEEANGKPINICGAAAELSDSDVQQFVNSKTNRPVGFALEHTEYEGTPLTIVRVRQKQGRPIFLNKSYGRLKQNVVYIRHGSSTDEASPDEIAEMARQEASAPKPDVELKFQITVDAYCYRSEFAMPFEKNKATYFDAFDIVATNRGNARAHHIEGTVELPRAILFDYLKETHLEGDNPLVSIARSKPIRLEFSNYLREPTHSHLTKPNPLEWKPLLPGRQMELLNERAVPLREQLQTLDSTMKWELAVDDCDFRKGETKFADIEIVKSET